MGSTELNLLIAGISASATVAAAIIYYRTLIEIRRQRENTYRPQLFIENSFFSVQGIKRNNIIFPGRWNEKAEAATYVQWDSGVAPIPEHRLNCYNIGFGTAKKITINLSFGMEEFLQQILIIEKGIPNEQRILIKRENRFILYNAVDEKMPFAGKGIGADSYHRQLIDYALPVNIKNEPLPIRIPTNFQELLNILVFYFMTNSDKELPEINAPIITAEIIYQDIADNSFTQNFTIATKMSALSSAFYSGEFQISERH